MLAFIKQYSTPLLVGVAIVVASLWVHDHTQQAVARALLKQQVDSITQKVKQDSVDAAARDSAFQAKLTQAAEAESAARAFAQAAHTSMHRALDSLAAAKTASDSIGRYQTALAQADTVIAQQQNQITAADAQIGTLKALVLDQGGQIANLRAMNIDLTQQLRKATSTSAWNGTTLTIVRTVLAAKGAYDVFRGR